MRVLNLFVCIFLTLFISCTKTDDHLKGDGTDWQLHVQVSDMQGSGPATKIIYSGEYSQHTEFETGDRFGLFVVVESGTAESPSVTVNHYEVYCSGLDNNGRTVWSIFRHFSDGHTSNYPLYEIMPEGSKAFAYYPYNSAYNNNSSVTVDKIKSIVANFGSTIPYDQSSQSSESAFTKYDLLVASNIEGCTYGEITRAEKSVTIRFSHAFAMLRFTLPAGSVKYDYKFNGNDFTPYKSSTAGGFDEYKFIFKPGVVLDIYIKYVFEDKFATGNFKNLFPITTEAGHCYYLDEKAPKVPYSTAVDMGTSVMWASFNLEAENDPTATVTNISTLKGTCVMWAVNKNIGGYGSNAYKSYNDSFTEGTKPSELPTSYNFSGDIKYDAARNMWGGEWRIPTQAEWQELFDACDYSIADGKITFTNTSTGNSITLKYAGYYDSATPSATNTGYYWSATSSADPTKAIATQFAATNTNTAVQLHPAANRYTGLPVRPVYSKNH